MLTSKTENLWYLRSPHLPELYCMAHRIPDDEVFQPGLWIQTCDELALKVPIVRVP